MKLYVSPMLRKSASNRARIFAQESRNSEVSGRCGDNKHRGLAFWLVSLSSSVPGLTRCGVGGGLHTNPWGEGAAKARYHPLLFL